MKTYSITYSIFPFRLNGIKNWGQIKDDSSQCWTSFISYSILFQDYHNSGKIGSNLAVVVFGTYLYRTKLNPKCF